MFSDSLDVEPSFQYKNVTNYEKWKAWVSWVDMTVWNTNNISMQKNREKGKEVKKKKLINQKVQNFHKVKMRV